MLSRRATLRGSLLFLCIDNERIGRISYEMMIGIGILLKTKIMDKK